MCIGQGRITSSTWRETFIFGGGCLGKKAHSDGFSLVKGLREVHVPRGAGLAGKMYKIIILEMLGFEDLRLENSGGLLSGRYKIQEGGRERERENERGKEKERARGGC